MFYYPWGIGADEDGNCFVADTFNYCTRKIDIHGNVSTIVGFLGIKNKNKTDTSPSSNANGLITEPRNVVHRNRCLYISDSKTNGVFKIYPNGNFEKIQVDGNVWNVCVDFQGSIFFTDVNNGDVRMVNIETGKTEIIASSANHFNSLSGITVDALGSVFVSERAGIRKISKSGKNWNVTALSLIQEDGEELKLEDCRGMDADFSAVYAVDYAQNIVIRIENPIPWNPNRHRYFPTKTKNSIKTILKMGLKNRNTGEAFHPSCCFYTLPRDIMYLLCQYICKC